MALLRDAHSRLLLNSVQPPLRTLPVQFGIFSEGIIITATTEPYRRWAGARVLRIGRVDAPEILERLRPLISHENDSWFRQPAPQRLASADILRYVGAIDDVERVGLRVSHDGMEEEIQLDVLTAGARPQWIDARAVANPTPFRRRTALDSLQSQ